MQFSGPVLDSLSSPPETGEGQGRGEGLDRSYAHRHELANMTHRCATTVHIPVPDLLLKDASFLFFTWLWRGWL